MRKWRKGMSNQGWREILLESFLSERKSTALASTRGKPLVCSEGRAAPCQDGAPLGAVQAVMGGRVWHCSPGWRSCRGRLGLWVCLLTLCDAGWNSPGWQARLSWREQAVALNSPSLAQGFLWLCECGPSPVPHSPHPAPRLPAGSPGAVTGDGLDGAWERRL